MQHISPYHRDIVWSRLPDIRKGSKLTEKSRHRTWKLMPHQLGQWHGFEHRVRNFSSSPRGLGEGPPVGGVSLPMQREHYRVSNEAGLTGRLIQNVGEIMGDIFEILSLPEFADTQAGKDVPPGCSKDAYPDFILLENPRNTCLVAEVKAFWNTDLENLDQNDFEAVYGQIAKYMDDCKCRYGILITYNQAVFIRRVGMYTFEKSAAIRHTQTSMPPPNFQISLKEAMLYMAYLAGNGERDARYNLTVGDALVDKTWKPPIFERSRR